MTRLDNDLISRKALLDEIKKIQANRKGCLPQTGSIINLVINAPTIEADSGEAVAIIKFTDSHINYVESYGSNCRECADNFGVCPNKGLPCKDARKTIEYIFKAIEYGINNSFLANPFTSPQKREWVELTDEQISKVYDELGVFHDHKMLAKAIQAKLKEVNHE